MGPRALEDAMARIVFMPDFFKQGETAETPLQAPLKQFCKNNGLTHPTVAENMSVEKRRLQDL